MFLLPTLRRFTLTTLFALLTLFIVRPAFAQGGHTFRLLPDPTVTNSSNRAYFIYDSEPGATMSDAVLVKNKGNEPINLKLYAADAVTGANGGVAVGTQLGETPSEAGSWLHLSESEITLQPDEERSVAFDVQIPDGMQPGEYGATIVAQPANETEADAQNGPVGIRFIPRVATSVLLTISGANPLQQQLNITNLRAETDTGQEILADLNNTGNDGIDNTEGLLTIRDTTGTTIQEIPVQLGYFLAGDSLTYRAGLDEKLAPGEYDVTLMLTYQEQLVEQSLRLSLADIEALPEVRDDVQPLPSNSNNEIPLMWIIIGGMIIVTILVLLIFWVLMQSWHLSRMQHRSQ